MYIDYLTEMNESHVKVAEFNTAPLMEPGFDYEEYYHEVSFLPGNFKKSCKMKTVQLNFN